MKNYFTHGRFPEVGQKQNTEKKKEKERAKVGDNNGQATHGARKHAWRTQAAWANIFFKLYFDPNFGNRSTVFTDKIGTQLGTKFPSL